ncbi:MAG: Rrf2 family transcriptional regulator, partial [Candidatus Omnitrophota bacterium]
IFGGFIPLPKSSKARRLRLSSSIWVPWGLMEPVYHIPITYASVNNERKGMKLITRDTDYAVRALIFIAQSKLELVTANELVNKLGIPRPFLRKLLQELNKSGLLASYKGKAGGFKLSVSPKNIRLTDLIRIFQGKFMINECLFKKKICPRIRICGLKHKIDAIEKKVAAELDAISIGKLSK